MKDEVKAKIKDRIANAIKTYLDGKEVTTTQILDDIFPVERRVRSIIGGLETSLGTTLWEPTAKQLAESNGYEILNEKEFPTPETMPVEVSAIISKWIGMRNKAGAHLTLDGFINEVKQQCKKVDYSAIPKETLASGEGIDLWIEKDGVQYVYDIKTNQINAKGGNSMSNSLMLWYASKFVYEPDADFKAAFAFPFNPYKKDWWDKNGGRAYPMVKNMDGFVGNEFWDKLSGEKNTLESILGLFKELGDENFGAQFKDVFYPPKK